MSSNNGDSVWQFPFFFFRNHIIVDTDNWSRSNRLVGCVIIYSDNFDLRIKVGSLKKQKRNVSNSTQVKANSCYSACDYLRGGKRTKTGRC